jgi:copper transport protein
MCILVWLGGIERRRSAALLWVSLGAAIVGTLLMIAGQAASIGGWWQWLDVVRTDSGRWWAARLVALVASVPLVLGRNSSRAARVAIGAWTVALAVIVAGGGHGRSGHLAGLAFPATVVHLIAMALWVGGIAVLLIAPRDDRGAMAVRFSPVALVSVAALAVTGTFNAWRQSSSIDALLASRYGDALLVKLSVIAAIIAIAATTRSLTRSGQHRTLPRTLSAEMLGFALVFAATAVLTASAPPRDIVSANAPVVITEGTRTLTLTLDPSGTPLSVVIQNPAKPDEAPTAIVVSGSLPGAGLGPIELPGRMIANGVWVSDDNPLPTPGRWTIQVVATYGEFDATTWAGQVEMPAPAPSA